MSMQSVIDFLENNREKRLALVCHQRPDGDAIGSCLGLAFSLTALGRDVTVVNALPLPDRLAFLDVSGLNLRRNDPDWHKDFDCLAVLDCGEAGRLDPLNQKAVDALPTCNIDHHVSSGGVGEAVWIEPRASSTGEMVVRLILAAGWPLPPAAADALWTAIITDTGRFSFENSTPAALAAARECVIAGARPWDVAAHVYQSVSPAERVLQAKILSRMRLLESGRLAFSWLNHADFAEAGLGPEVDMEAVNLLRDTAGVEVAVFLYELAPDAEGRYRVKASLRTRSPHNAIDVVKQFDGGGHMRAAGCSLDLPLAEAEGRILDAVKAAFFADGAVG